MIKIKKKFEIEILNISLTKFKIIVNDILTNQKSFHKL
jgi:hypothetical protein